ncbi:Apoptosis regulator BAX [Trichoplax sp. H2]|nr:Apoptosis regulator BAX [Trichoplax sp. H2]|eukprot:RDD39254.1 Apoptosis regulator BAX [Trichoplax sp. H2]
MAHVKSVTSTPTTTTTTTTQSCPRREENLQEIAAESKKLFLDFIADRSAKDGQDQGCISQLTREHNELQIEPTSPTIQVARTIRQIGDELDSDPHLNGLLHKLHVTSSTAYSTFRRVAMRIFQDGQFNWGRIITLFFFGYRLTIRVLSESPIVEMIISWIARFIYEICSFWIAESGGWDAITQYIQQADWKNKYTLGLIAVGVLVTAFVTWQRYNSS